MNVANKKTDFEEEAIIIDEAKGLIFNSEEEVLAHFEKPVDHLEDEFLKTRLPDDFDDDKAADLEDQLEDVLQNPDEVWFDDKTIKGQSLYTYIKSFSGDNNDHYHYIAVTYLSEETPTFIYLHFPTKFGETTEHYRRGEQVFDRKSGSSALGGIAGDALSESDELALGLYQAMLVVRSENDIPESLFQNYSELREESIEEADEIWRNTTMSGYTLVSFIKDFSRYENNNPETLYYMSVTIEDEGTNSHALLFSFPTNDESLIERYRHGENLHADEVVQESSH